jgi:membrane fusion protein (multidrug efflux system)
MAEAVATMSAERSRIGVRPILFGSIVLAIAAAVSYWAVVLRGYETTNDAFIEGHIVFLSPRVAGQVVEVLVQENQRVAAGDVLVKLDPSDYDARVARARADLDVARNRMTQSEAAAAGAAAQVAAAQATLRHSEQELGRVRNLHSSDAASKSDLDAAIATRDSAVANLHAAEQQEKAERASLGSEAPVRQAEAVLREAELALSHTVVTAPFAGKVGRKSVELGANVTPGQPLVAVAEDTTNWVTANFKETQIEEMNPGDDAEIRVDAYPDAVIHGHVESIAPATGAKYALLPPDNASGNFTKVVQRVPVRIALDPPPAGSSSPDLSVGLSVDVRVHVR